MTDRGPVHATQAEGAMALECLLLEAACGRKNEKAGVSSGCREQPRGAASVETCGGETPMLEQSIKAGQSEGDSA